MLNRVRRTNPKPKIPFENGETRVPQNQPFALPDVKLGVKVVKNSGPDRKGSKLKTQFTVWDEEGKNQNPNGGGGGWKNGHGTTTRNQTRCGVRLRDKKPKDWFCVTRGTDKNFCIFLGKKRREEWNEQLRGLEWRSMYKEVV